MTAVHPLSIQMGVVAPSPNGRNRSMLSYAFHHMSHSFLWGNR